MRKNKNEYTPEYEDQNQEYIDSYEDSYDEEDYYSREEAEREERYQNRVRSRQEFKQKITNPFNLKEKIDKMDEELQYGSSKSRLVFALVGAGAFLICLIILFLFL